ncbi:MAG: helix-turn-helix domain protein [Firmicutes bacterium]|nr:helix-turn-helix domain protein [Bacillota bacterium]
MLGDKIRTLRLERNLELETLAEAVGVSAMAIQYYEENKWRPGTEIIVRLAHAFGVKITDIVEGCDILHNENGEMLLVCNNNGKKIKVLCRIKEEFQQMCQKEF